MRENGATIRINNGYFCSRTLHANSPEVQVIFHVSVSCLQYTVQLLFIYQVMPSVCANTGMCTHSIYIMIGSVWLTCLNFHHQLKSFFSAETLMIACDIFKFDCGRTESAGVLDYMNLTLCEFKCLCDTMIGLPCS